MSSLTRNRDSVLASTAKCRADQQLLIDVKTPNTDQAFIHRLQFWIKTDYSQGRNMQTRALYLLRLLKRDPN